MKKLITTMLFFASFNYQVGAMCLSHSINVWPGSNEINTNSIFIIEGYGSSQYVIHKLNNKYKIYLTSGNSIIPLQVLKIYQSQYELTQAILKPTSLLIEGNYYTLKIDSLDFDKEEFDRNHFQWKATKEADDEIPTWTQNPIYIGKEKIHYGCGPASFVNFCVCINDNSPVAIYTKLKALKTGKVAEYYVIPDTICLQIGHGMCSGEFDFEDGEDYEVSFSLMDASGNTNDTLTNAIKFISPTDNDRDISENIKLCDCPKVEEIKQNSISAIVSTLLIIASMLALLMVGNRKIVS